MVPSTAPAARDAEPCGTIDRRRARGLLTIAVMTVTRGFAAASIAIALSGCSVYFGDDDPEPDPGPGTPVEADRIYQLEPRGAWAAEGQVAGLAWDGEAFWIAYRYEVGGYYDNDEIEIVRWDPTTGERFAEYFLADEYAPVAGLAWTGDALWINYNTRGGAGPQLMKRLDPASGDVTSELATPIGISDIDYDGENLVLANIWNRVQRVDATTGALGGELAVPWMLDSTVRGVAVRPGEIWLSSQADDDLTIMAPDGTLLGRALIDMLDDTWNFGAGFFLTFAGENIVFVSDNQLYMFEPVPAP